jgi:hypothetical protein
MNFRKVNTYEVFKYSLFLGFFIILSLSFLVLFSTKSNIDNGFSTSLRPSTENFPAFEVVLNSENELDLVECKSLALNKIATFSEIVDSLEKFVIHDRTDLRRGLANSSKIYLRCLPDKQEFINVLVHEIGHVVDLGHLVGSETTIDTNFHDFGTPVKLDDSSYDFYSISWIDNDTWRVSTSNESFVSGYAATDPFEDFAESFMMYVLYPEVFVEMASNNWQLFRKYNFMKNTVFDGVEFQSEDKVILSSYGLDLNKIRLYDATQIHRFIAYDL